MNTHYFVKILLSLILLLGKGIASGGDPSVIVIFGATGDLTNKKLVPALGQLAKEGNLSENSIILGVARRDLTHEEFRQQMGENLDADFKKRIFYHQLGFENDKDYETLRQYLTELDQQFGAEGNRLFYLATGASYFSPIIKQLKTHELINTQGSPSWSRVIIEKPFGMDLPSAMALQEEISKYLDPSQVFRMDHYLGKEGVQNLLTLRFENQLFEPLWNHEYIDNVQITLSEEMGIGTRGNFWEETGALRDLFQNHLMQILAILAMESPDELKPASIHEEKIRVLESIRPFPVEKIPQYVVRGQYGKGVIQGENVIGYRQEPQVAKDSSVETYLAAKIYIDNERWQGVPFYLRAGKRLAKQTVEIAINFKSNNVLFVRIQPQMGIFLKTLAKAPGLHQKTNQLVTFGYTQDEIFGVRSPEAYEKLLYDCLQGDSSLFVESDEQLAAWRILSPVLEYWKNHPSDDVPNYSSGSWGPKDAEKLVQEQGHQWVLLN